MRRTRPQFQEWCGGLAAEYGYTVGFQDLGHAVEEATAVADSAAPFHGTDIGGSTQASRLLVFHASQGVTNEVNKCVPAMLTIVTSCQEGAAPETAAPGNTSEFVPSDLDFKPDCGHQLRPCEIFRMPARDTATCL